MTVSLAKRTDRKPFTDTTWDDFYILTNRHDSVYGKMVGWEAQTDLAYELSYRSNLTFEQCRELISAVLNGMPLVLTWVNENCPNYGTDELIKATVVVDELRPTSVSFPRSNPGTVRVSRWGFSHPVWLTQIRSVEVPSVEYSYTPTTSRTEWL